MSDCVFEFTGQMVGEKFGHRCTVCGREVRSKHESPNLKANCPAGRGVSAIALVPPPQFGAGSELSSIFKELGIAPKPSCGCQAKGRKMNEWGVAGCLSRRSDILEWLIGAYDSASFGEWIAAGASAFLQGKPKSVAGLFDLAIERAVAKGHLRPPLKVAFLAPSLLLGGAERWIASLCRHFDPAKVWPQAIALTEPKHRSPIVEGWLPKHIKVVSADLLSAITSQVDVLISWGTADLAERTRGAKCHIVDVQHGTVGFGDVQRRLASAGIKANAHLAAVGEACLDNYPPSYRELVTVIQNGAEVERLQPIEGRETARAKLGIQPGEKVCLYIGRIAPVKNLPALAAAIERLPGWRLVVAGPAYVPVPLGSRAIVLPAQEHLGDLFAAADVFCAPSHHEANSLAVMEAMLAGVPTVTTDHPAALALEKRHGPMSWLVPVNPDPQDLADEIVEASGWRDSPRVKRIQQIAMESYTAKAMAGRWQNYLSTLGAPNGRS